MILLLRELLRSSDHLLTHSQKALRFWFKQCSTIRTRHGLHTIYFIKIRSESKIWIACIQISAWFPLTSLQSQANRLVTSSSNFPSIINSHSSIRSCTNSSKATTYIKNSIFTPLFSMYKPATWSWSREWMCEHTTHQCKIVSTSQEPEKSDISLQRRWCEST